MSGESIGIKEVYEIARKKFPKGHLAVEIWDIGLRFVWESESPSGSAVLQEPLDKISASTILGNYFKNYIDVSNILLYDVVKVLLLLFFIFINFFIIFIIIIRIIL